MSGVSLGLRKCDSHQGGMKCIKYECQLMERCDGHDHGGGVRECLKVSLMENYDDHGGGEQGVGRWDSFWEFDSHQGGVKGIRNVC